MGELEELKKEITEIKANQKLIVENLRRRPKESRRIVLEALKRALDDTSSLIR